MLWFKIGLVLSTIFSFLCKQVDTSPSVFQTECRDKVIREIELDGLPDTIFTIVSPNYPGYYPKGVLCSFKIKSPREDISVQLQVEMAAIGNPGVCGLDSLTVYDGPSNKSVLLGRHCYNTGSYESSSEYLFVQFSSLSPHSLRGNGFRATYYYTDENFNTKPTSSGDVNIGGIIAGVVAAFIAISIMLIIVCRDQLRKICRNNERRMTPNISVVPNVQYNTAPPPYVPKVEEPTDDPPPSYEEVMASMRC